MIGVGVLPVFATLAWLLGARWRLPDERALAATLVGAIVAFGLYTAVKASYLSTDVCDPRRGAEPDLRRTARLRRHGALGALRTSTRLIPVLLSAAAVWYLLDTTPYHNTEHFYSDAPGLSVLQWLNRKPFYFTTTDAHRLLLGILIGSVVLMALREVARRRGALRRLALPAAALLALAIVGWNLTGEIVGRECVELVLQLAARRAADPARLDRPGDRARAGRCTSANRSGAPTRSGRSSSGTSRSWTSGRWMPPHRGPVPTVTPNYRDLTGAVDPQLPIEWIVATPGVDPAGELRETVGGLRLFHVRRPIRIAAAQGGLSPDAAWMSTASFYYHFAPKGPEPGTATVSLSRAAACGGYPPSHLTIRLSTLRINGDGQPVAGRPLATKRLTLRSNPCQTKVVRIPAVTPFRIDVTARGTFQPSQYDQRELSAQVAFGFVPRR